MEYKNQGNEKNPPGKKSYWITQKIFESKGEGP